MMLVFDILSFLVQMVILLTILLILLEDLEILRNDFSQSWLRYFKTLQRSTANKSELDIYYCKLYTIVVSRVLKKL